MELSDDKLKQFLTTGPNYQQYVEEVKEFHKLVEISYQKHCRLNDMRNAYHQEIKSYINQELNK